MQGDYERDQQPENLQCERSGRGGSIQVHFHKGLLPRILGPEESARLCRGDSRADHVPHEASDEATFHVPLHLALHLCPVACPFHLPSDCPSFYLCPDRPPDAVAHVSAQYLPYDIRADRVPQHLYTECVTPDVTTESVPHNTTNLCAFRRPLYPPDEGALLSPLCCPDSCPAHISTVRGPVYHQPHPRADRAAPTPRNRRTDCCTLYFPFATPLAHSDGQSPSQPHLSALGTAFVVTHPETVCAPVPIPVGLAFAPPHGWSVTGAVPLPFSERTFRVSFPHPLHKPYSG
eukprot:Hpha_TRINITY_DN18652_c0_g1::TRINITY_DN18652_c0_g1_i1::g.115673::m.115673